MRLAGPAGPIRSCEVEGREGPVSNECHDEGWPRSYLELPRLAGLKKGRFVRGAQEGLRMCKGCKRPVPLQSPETPKPQKCILKSEKCHFRPPGKMAPKVKLLGN